TLVSFCNGFAERKVICKLLRRGLSDNPAYVFDVAKIISHSLVAFYWNCAHTSSSDISCRAFVGLPVPETVFSGLGAEVTVLGCAFICGLAWPAWKSPRYCACTISATAISNGM